MITFYGESPKSLELPPLSRASLGRFCKGQRWKYNIDFNFCYKKQIALLEGSIQINHLHNYNAAIFVKNRAESLLSYSSLIIHEVKLPVWVFFVVIRKFDIWNIAVVFALFYEILVELLNWGFWNIWAWILIVDLFFWGINILFAKLFL